MPAQFNEKMNRKNFFYLYVNLNSLVELGMRKHAEELLASLPESAAMPELTPEEAEARMMKTFENMDMSALDQVWENLDKTPLDMEAVNASQDRSWECASEPEATNPASSEDDVVTDLDGYMRRAYECEGELSERIDRLFAKADLVTMSRQVEQLGGAPPLTAVLNGTQMKEWLDRYVGDDAVLIDLATEVRRLEMTE